MREREAAALQVSSSMHSKVRQHIGIARAHIGRNIGLLKRSQVGMNVCVARDQAENARGDVAIDWRADEQEVRARLALRLAIALREQVKRLQQKNDLFFGMQMGQ